MRLLFFTCVALISFLTATAQPHQPSAAEIKLKLKKLNFLGSVLYVAAHPDDENTRVIAYLASERLAATAYLSMTRGDGGQNLIGPEIRDLLGLIRTQELLAARKLDGGEQFFTRANDFGFSKNQQETFAIWNREEILGDVVKVFRQYQPDVVITRFPPDERAGHGHHTASAVLAQEAFDQAANASAYPSQLKELGTWQAKRLFTNTGRWWNTTIDDKTPGVVTLNVGSYNVLLGKSYSEIAAESRTQHKSQGFGSPGRRGDAPEYFEWVKGEQAQKDIFDHVNTTWSRIKGANKVQVLVSQAIAEFNEEKPAASIPILLQVRKEIEKLETGVWRNRKLNEVNQLLRDCAGLYAEAIASFASSAPGEPIAVSFELVNRAGNSTQLTRLRSTALSFDSTTSLTLAENRLVTFKTKKELSKDARLSAPYWLRSDHSLGLFTVPNPAMIGMPQNDPAVVITGEFIMDGERLTVDMPLIYKWTDPVKGELWQPFEITSPVSVSVAPGVLLFPDTHAKEVNVLVKSFSSQAVAGTLELELPAGWKVEPAAIQFSLAKRSEEKNFKFSVIPPIIEQVASLKAVAKIGSEIFDRSVQTISYPHIPTQTLQPVAQAKIVRADIKKEGSSIGYIKGAGDEIPTALRSLGYEVWEMKNEEVTAENLARLDAVVLGVRALNTNERIRYMMPSLLDYVKNGGTMVVQYNTNFDLEIDADKFSPYPIKLSRDRVTQENSGVTILSANHSILNFPNAITDRDFVGWVQERGLYFPTEWAPEFEPLLAMHDEGEPERKGALIAAKYGKGTYIYTGLSFFRELPEGVAGAYKLFANLVSSGKQVQPKSQKIKPSQK